MKLDVKLKIEYDDKVYRPVALVAKYKYKKFMFRVPVDIFRIDFFEICKGEFLRRLEELRNSEEMLKRIKERIMLNILENENRALYSNELINQLDGLRLNLEIDEKELEKWRNI